VTGLLEVFSTIAIDQMLRGSGRAAGDYGEFFSAVALQRLAHASTVHIPSTSWLLSLISCRQLSGFDPLGFGKDPKNMADLQMKELANGRLAMFAFSGMVTQAVLTGGTFPYLY